jgi:hypothetical protein
VTGANSNGAPAAPGAFRSLLLMAGALFVALVATEVPLRAPLAKIPIVLGGWSLLWMLAAVCFVPGFLLAEEASARWGHRAWIYAAVVLLGSAAVASTTVALSDTWGLFAPFHAYNKSGALRSFIAFLEVVWRIGLAAAVYASHRQRLAAAQAFQQLETRRTWMMGRLAESRLRKTPARVRPEAFIEELRALRGRYLEEPAAAEAALDGMILRLRAASRGVAQ